MIAKGATLIVSIMTTPEKRKYLTKKRIVELFTAQDGRCANCQQKLAAKGYMLAGDPGGEDFIVEHVTALNFLGTNDISNLQLWCKPCATVKTAKEATQRGKMLRQRDAHIGAKRPSKNPIRGSKASGWKCRLTSEGPKWERRD